MNAKNVHDLDISFVGSGRYGDVFRLSNGRHAVILKLSYYRDNTLSDFTKLVKEGFHADARRTKNKDAIMVSNHFSQIANSLMISRISPHFVFVYCNADCKHIAEKMASLIPQRMKTSTPTQLKYNNVCLMEQFTSDMTKWIRGRAHTFSDDVLRAAIFGVVYTLAALQKQYPGFRHNDLSTNNVLVKRLHKPAALGYRYGRDSYYISSTPIMVALSDYDFTHVPGHRSLQNERVLSKKYRVTEHPNMTYDTHFFLKSVLKSLQSSKHRHAPRTMAFLAHLPLEKEDRLDTKQIMGLEPSVLLSHTYFAPFRKRIPRGVTVYAV